MKGKNQKNKISSYMQASLRQNTFLSRLNEEFQNIQLEKAEKPPNCDKNANEIEDGTANTENPPNRDQNARKIEDCTANAEMSMTPMQDNELKALKEKCFKLQQENAKLTKDNKLLKKMLDESKSINLHKDIKISKLRFQLHSQQKKQDGQALTNLFTVYEQNFSPSEMKRLRSIGKGERNDSSFVSKCVTFLHDGQANIINRTATSTYVPGKVPLSPDKIEIASNMLSERLGAEGIPNEVVAAREARFNKLLNNAIATARKAVANANKVPLFQKDDEMCKQKPIQNDIDLGITQSNMYVQPVQWMPPS